MEERGVAPTGLKGVATLLGGVSMSEVGVA